MRSGKVDILVLGIGLICVVMFAGMALNSWNLIVFAVPVLIGLLLLMGSLNSSDRWSGGVLLANILYSGTLLALFWAAGFAYHGDSILWGMGTSTAIFALIGWPFTTVSAGLFYAYIFKSWLSRDISASARPETSR